MASFSITYKPNAMTPEEGGLPVEEYQRLVRRLDRGDLVERRWLFRNKSAKPNDRVFLLLQGEHGPAVIGYGRIKSGPNGNRPATRSIAFEKLVDFSTEVLANRSTLDDISQKSFLSVAFSGCMLKNDIALKLEGIVKNTSRLARSKADALDDVGCDAPDRVKTTGFRYLRDREIRTKVKLRAKGKCEFCGERGFDCTDRTPYLECHHIIALAADGADRMTNVIALCPKDHREAHFGQRAEELERQMIQKLRIIEASDDGSSGDRCVI